MANHRLTAVMTLAGIMGSNSPWIAAIVAVVFTTLARFVKGVSRSGAVAGAVICFALIASAGLGAFVALISVFALTWIATRFGYRRKQTLGIAGQRQPWSGRGLCNLLLVLTPQFAVPACNGCRLCGSRCRHCFE